MVGSCVGSMISMLLFQGGGLIKQVYMSSLVMSWVSFVKSFLVGGVLVSLVFWKLWILLMVFLCLFVSSSFVVSELLFVNRVSYLGYWLFLLGEAIAFISLIYCQFWYSKEGTVSISNYMDVPLLGCFVLLSSSMFATLYHYECGSLMALSWLRIAMFLGLSFMVCQVIEFYETHSNLLVKTHDAASFCVVGLHFLHVMIGLVLLYSLMRMEGLIYWRSYRVSLVVWYWHFVDLMWLFVYFSVYVMG